MINLLAFPGLGTILGKRREGYVQAVLMLTGFILLTGFMVFFIYCSFKILQTQGTMEEFKAAYEPYAWAGYSGLALSAVAWLWSLYSSIQIMRHPRKNS